MKPHELISSIQKAANLKTHASAVEILKLLQENENNIKELVESDWYRQFLKLLKELANSSVISGESFIFERNFVKLVADLLTKLRLTFS
jgi:hypothetical protein